MARGKTAGGSTEGSEDNEQVVGKIILSTLDTFRNDGFGKGMKVIVFFFENYKTRPEIVFPVFQRILQELRGDFNGRKSGQKQWGDDVGEPSHKTMRKLLEAFQSYGRELRQLHPRSYTQRRLLDDELANVFKALETAR